jgi:hypothetical protein
MANVKKANRVQDVDIKRLNHVGLGLKAIADLLGCHPATITLRLKDMGIEPTDTRRSFMESVFTSLTPAEQDWLSHNLFNASIGIKEFVAKLIREAYSNEPAVAAPTPVAMPVMQSVTEPVKAEEEPVKFEEFKVTPEIVDPIELVNDTPPPAPTKSLFG